jgi:dinuclear metal center YbgI/SA1388 family protein
MLVTVLDLIAEWDRLLRPAEFDDYAPNGLQVPGPEEVGTLATGVTASVELFERAAAEGAQLVLVHHGLFWKGMAQHVDRSMYRRLRPLFLNDIALAAYHLPLDAHPELGNNALLARALGLAPSGEFARYKTIAVGVRGESELPTRELVDRAAAFARARGGAAIVTPFADDRRTRRWAICTGAGASSETLAEAEAAGVDTLIVGEGPHHTAVEAEERGVVVVYAGHYATETLGVAALAEHVGRRFGVPWSFIEAPTGL